MLGRGTARSPRSTARSSAPRRYRSRSASQREPSASSSSTTGASFASIGRRGRRAPRRRARRGRTRRAASGADIASEQTRTRAERRAGGRHGDPSPSTPATRLVPPRAGRPRRGDAARQRRAGVVGATGFEPATSSSRTKRATKLRHAPRLPRLARGPSIRPREVPSRRASGPSMPRAPRGARARRSARFSDRPAAAFAAAIRVAVRRAGSPCVTRAPCCCCWRPSPSLALVALVRLGSARPAPDDRSLDGAAAAPRRPGRRGLRRRGARLRRRPGLRRRDGDRRRRLHPRPSLGAAPRARRVSRLPGVRSVQSLVGVIAFRWDADGRVDRGRALHRRDPDGPGRARRAARARARRSAVPPHAASPTTARTAAVNVSFREMTDKRVPRRASSTEKIEAILADEAAPRPALPRRGPPAPQARRLPRHAARPARAGAGVPGGGGGRAGAAGGIAARRAPAADQRRHRGAVDLRRGRRARASDLGADRAARAGAAGGRQRLRRPCGRALRGRGGAFGHRSRGVSEGARLPGDPGADLGRHHVDRIRVALHHQRARRLRAGRVLGARRRRDHAVHADGGAGGAGPLAAATRAPARRRLQRDRGRARARAGPAERAEPAAPAGGDRVLRRARRARAAAGAAHPRRHRLPDLLRSRRRGAPRLHARERAAGGRGAALRGGGRRQARRRCASRRRCARSSGCSDASTSSPACRARTRCSTRCGC